MYIDFPEGQWNMCWDLVITIIYVINTYSIYNSAKSITINML